MDVLKPPAERVLVCVGPSASSANLINSAKKMAAGLNANGSRYTSRHPRCLFCRKQSVNRAADNLRLAEQLGAETFTLTGRNIPKI